MIQIEVRSSGRWMESTRTAGPPLPLPVVFYLTVFTRRVAQGRPRDGVAVIIRRVG